MKSPNSVRLAKSAKTLQDNHASTAAMPATETATTAMIKTKFNQLASGLSGYFYGRRGTGVNAVSGYAVLRPLSLALIVTTLTMVMSPSVHAMQAKSQLDAQKNIGGATARYIDKVRELKDGQTIPNFLGAPHGVSLGVRRVPLKTG
jgi:hypothetical protein